MSPRARFIARAQGAYYLATGVAPFVSRRAFEAVTGPKVDFWLVRTVGALSAVIGGVLAASARRDRISPELEALGIGAALAFAAIDVAYVGKRRISPVYLVDAALELALIAAWQRARATRTRPANAGARARPPVVESAPEAP